MARFNCNVSSPEGKVKWKSGHTNWTILWNVHFLSPLAWNTRRVFWNFWCCQKLWRQSGDFPDSMPPWFAREAFRHWLDQNSIDKDFEQSLTHSSLSSWVRNQEVCVKWWSSLCDLISLLLTAMGFGTFSDGIVNTYQPVACRCSPMISQGHSSTGRLGDWINAPPRSLLAGSSGPAPIQQWCWLWVY